jgi:hypothetical protein
METKGFSVSTLDKTRYMTDAVWSNRVNTVETLSKKVGMMIWIDHQADNTIYLIESNTLETIASGDIDCVEAAVARYCRLKAFL